MLRQCAVVTMVVAIVSTNAILSHAQQPFFMGLGDLPGGGFFSYPDDISSAFCCLVLVFVLLTCKAASSSDQLAGALVCDCVSEIVSETG